MKKDEMIKIAERNLKKAKTAMQHNYNRQGITEKERENLSNNLEYAQRVYDLILTNM